MGGIMVVSVKFMRQTSKLFLVVGVLGAGLWASVVLAQAPVFFPTPTPTPSFGFSPVESCFDGVDNDRNGQIDCEDSYCQTSNQFCAGYPGTEICNDKIDNNTNGLTDCDDQACYNYGYYGYFGYPYYYNYPYYYGYGRGREACPLTVAGNERGVWGIPMCQDSYDNDHDGATDCADSDCGTDACPATPSPLPVAIAGALEDAAPTVSGAVAAVAAVSALVSVGGAAASAQSGPELLRSLLPFSAVHRRQAPWGRVVEQQSNRPIAGVELSLIDETGKVRATEQSRSDGTFGFFVPPGNYRLVEQRMGYQFPAPAPDIALFPGEVVYDGGWIPIAEESILSLVVVGQKLSNSSLDTFFERLSGIWVHIQIWQARLAWPLLLFGAGLTALSFWNSPSWFLGGLLGIYVLLFFLEIFLSRLARRAVGKVKDVVTKKGLGLAVVRLSDEQGRLVSTRVTLPSGQFLLMPSPGVYRVDITKAGYQPYTKEQLKVRKYFLGVASVRAKLTPV